MNVNIRPKYLSKTSFWNTFGNVRSWKIGYGATPRGFAAERETARRSAPCGCRGAREFLLHSSRPFKGCKLLRPSLHPIRHIVQLFPEYFTVCMCLYHQFKIFRVWCMRFCVLLRWCVGVCVCSSMCLCVCFGMFVPTEYNQQKLKMTTRTHARTNIHTQTHSHTHTHTHI